MPIGDPHGNTLPTWRHGFVVVSTTPLRLCDFLDWDLFDHLTIVNRGGYLDYDDNAVWLGSSPGLTPGLSVDTDGFALARGDELTLPLRKPSSLWLVTTTVTLPNDEGETETRPAQVLIEWVGA